MSKNPFLIASFDSTSPIQGFHSIFGPSVNVSCHCMRRLDQTLELSFALHALSNYLWSSRHEVRHDVCLINHPPGSENHLGRPPQHTNLFH